MKREDAIWILELIRNRDARTDAEKDAVNAAIEALKAQLYCKGTTSDLISRQAVIDIVVFECGKWTGLAKEISKQLKQLPPAQPERAEGEWSDGYRWQRCSLCKQTGKKSWNYCPNCGAKMKGAKHEGN